METGTGPKSFERFAELALDIQVIHEDLEETAVREGIHKWIQAEIHQKDKEREAQGEEMLEIPLECYEVPDLIMEIGYILPEDMRPDKQRRDEISQGWRKRRKGDNIRAEKREHSPTVRLGGYKIQRDYIPKVGTKTNKRKMSGKHQTSFRRSHRWCFAMES